MAASNFKRSLEKVLVHEGGYSNHPKDPGGATMKGVTQKVYDAYRVGKGLAKRSVKHVSVAELQDIYRGQYWDAVKGEAMPAGLDYVMFDGAVNSGPKQAIKWLQKAIGASPDGVLGAVTVTALAAEDDIDAVIDRVCAARLRFLKALKTWPTFGAGWQRRVDDVERTGKAWAMPDRTAPPKVSFMDDGGDAKAYFESAETRPTKGSADAAAGIGGTLATVGAGVAYARSELSAYADLSFINDVLPWLGLAGLVVGTAGLAWRWHQKRQEAKRTEALSLESTQ